MYERLIETMLPTLAKSHYTFNLRDLAKVFQGILSVTPEHCQDVRTFIYLWVHESQRVFQDRLVNHADKVTASRGFGKGYGVQIVGVSLLG
jgi:dynein heavy chain